MSFKNDWKSQQYIDPIDIDNVIAETEKLIADMKKPKRRRRSPLIYICALLIAVSSVCNCTLSGIYAKYATQNSASDGARVAGYEFDVSNNADGSGTFTLDLSSLDFVPGTGSTSGNWITVYVTNKTNCEVALEYTLDFSEIGNVDVGYQIVTQNNGLTGSDKKYSTVNKDAEGNDIGSLASGLPLDGGKTQTSGKMPAGKEAVHTYVLAIYSRGRVEDKDPSIAGEAEYVTLTIESKQID